MVFVTGALLVARATPTWGQEASLDPRWLAFVGCWESVAAAAQQVCVIPAPGTSGVDIATVVGGQIVARERIVPTVERMPSNREGCTGWESAEWSLQGQRVYLRSEYHCSGGLERVSNGLIAMSPSGEWLQVQGVTVGGQTGVAVRRYRETTAPAALASEAAPKGGVRAVTEARAAAAAPLDPDAVVEASRHLDAAVVEAWLAERGDRFSLNAKRLVKLVDAGVPGRIIDLMVALAYPGAFSINRVSRQAERVAGRRDSSGKAVSAPIAVVDRFCHAWWDYFSPYGCSPFGFSFYSPFGYGPYDGSYPQSYAVVIVTRGDGSFTPRSHGRVVNGRGYGQGDNAGGTPAHPREPSAPTWFGAGETSSAGIGSGSSSGTSPGTSSGSGETRTAKPRPN